MVHHNCLWLLERIFSCIFLIKIYYYISTKYTVSRYLIRTQNFDKKKNVKYKQTSCCTFRAKIYLKLKNKVINISNYSTIYQPNASLAFLLLLSKNFFNDYNFLNFTLIIKQKYVTKISQASFYKFTRTERKKIIILCEVFCL